MNLLTNTLRPSRRFIVGATGAVPLIALALSAKVASGPELLETKRPDVLAQQLKATPELTFSFIGSPLGFVSYDDQAHLFAFGSDENLYHTFLDGEAWSEWQALNHPEVPANTDVPPTVVQVGSSIMVIWCAFNGNVNVCLRPVQSDWNFEDSPNTIEGYSPFSSEVKAAYLGPRIFLFGTSEFGQCAYTEFSLRSNRGVWSYIDADWLAVGTPTTTITESGLDVFWMSDSGQVHQTSFDPNDWETWESVG